MFSLKIVTHSHYLGEQTIDQQLVKPLIEAIESIEITFKQEKKNGTEKIREELLKVIQKLGWSKPVKIDRTKTITITSMQKNIGMCIQTGNVSRFYADLLKLQTLYLNNHAEGAIYIIPDKPTADRMNSNTANFERFVHELNLFKKTITIPLFVIGIKVE